MNMDGLYWIQRKLSKKISVCLMIIVTTYIFWKKSEWYRKPSVKFEPFFVLPTRSKLQIERLPDLKKLRWPPVQYPPNIVGQFQPNGERFGKPDKFEPVFSRGQRLFYELAFKAFSQVMEHHSLGDRFFIHAGTLIGSIRHHDLIPWDDEADVMLDISIRSEALDALKTLAPKYLIFDDPQRRWNLKLYTAFLNESQEPFDLPAGRNTHKYGWGWPFLDIAMYEHNETHVWECGEHLWSRKSVFPLLYRPLGHQWLPAPYNPIEYLNTMISWKYRCSVGYNHAFETRSRTKVVNCTSLAQRYPFVDRMRTQLPPSFAEVKHGDDLIFTEERLMQFENGSDPVVYHTLILPSNVGNAELPIFT